MSDVPEHIDPRTSRAIVAFQSRRSGHEEPDLVLPVIRKISYTNPTSVMKHSLVHEFEYHKESGDVHFNIKAQEGNELGYARLVTLNSWYIALFSSAMFMCLSAMDMQANFTLCVEMLNDPDEYRQFWFSKYFFMVFWCFLVSINIAIAVREALWEWTIKSSALVGDLITECNWVDTWAAFLALVMFRFFFIEMHVKDIVILLHPWKMVQPFAAVKIENARSYIVGFPNEYTFRVENRAGQQLGLPVQLVTKLLILGFKVWLAYWITSGHQWPLMASSISTAGSTLWICIKLYWVLSDRRECKRLLLEQLEKGDECDRSIARKLLKLHFKIGVTDNGQEYSVSRMSCIAEQLSGCIECGRRPGEDGMPPLKAQQAAGGGGPSPKGAGAGAGAETRLLPAAGGDEKRVVPAAAAVKVALTPPVPPEPRELEQVVVDDSVHTAHSCDEDTIPDARPVSDLGPGDVGGGGAAPSGGREGGLGNGARASDLRRDDRLRGWEGGVEAGSPHGARLEVPVAAAVAAAAAGSPHGPRPDGRNVQPEPSVESLPGSVCHEPPG